MCFGGGSSPAAPVEQPAVPVDVISAGQPTVSVAPAKTAANASTPSPAPAAQNTGATGLNM